MLVVGIDRFEAQYAGDTMASSPIVMIEGEARLLRGSDHRTIATRHFSASVVAEQNRAGAIVAAYDRAANRIISQMTDWVEASAADDPR